MYAMSYRDLEEIVEGEFGCDWSFVVVEGLSNSSCKKIVPSVEGFEDELIYASASDILGELVKRKILPFGTYLIEVDW